jgi:preprotein translocase SecE subunit
MAVALKNASETKPARLLGGLATDSLVGVFYVLAALALIFWALPALWAAAVRPLFGAFDYAAGALKILVMAVAAIAVIAWGARRLAQHPLRGLRAGIFVGCCAVLVIVLFISAIGPFLEASLGQDSATIGRVLVVAIAAGLLLLLAYGYTRPGIEKLLVRFEEQGWFDVHAYKRAQGQRVRRGTILGILLLGGCGIFTLLRHNTLAAGSPEWVAVLPFTGGYPLVLLPAVQFTLPLLLSALVLWLAYRVVNLPVFADFLIATEAELNKVSWTSRKRLIQDTIVVLVTVLLLTVFLFVVDQAWGYILTKVGVLQLAPPSAQQQGPREQPW